MWWKGGCSRFKAGEAVVTNLKCDWRTPVVYSRTPWALFDIVWVSWATSNFNIWNWQTLRLWAKKHDTPLRVVCQKAREHWEVELEEALANQVEACWIWERPDRVAVMGNPILFADGGVPQKERDRCVTTGRWELWNNYEVVRGDVRRPTYAGVGFVRKGVPIPCICLSWFPCYRRYLSAASGTIFFWLNSASFVGSIDHLLEWTYDWSSA